MHRIAFILALLFSANQTYAEDGNPKVTEMLKKNAIVNAALTEAKAFSGATECEYVVASNEPPQFEKGTTLDYSAEIKCINEEAAAIIRVHGRMMPDTPQALTLSIEFAG